MDDHVFSRWFTYKTPGDFLYIASSYVHYRMGFPTGVIQNSPQIIAFQHMCTRTHTHTDIYIYICVCVCVIYIHIYIYKCHIPIHIYICMCVSFIYKKHSWIPLISATFFRPAPLRFVTLEFIRLRRGESGSLLAEAAGVGVTSSEMETVLTGGGRAGGSKVWEGWTSWMVGMIIPEKYRCIH